MRQAERLPVPVIIVGNISVGGTGKTPVVIALTEALRAAGRTPGVISRGYGGSERGPALLPGDATPGRFGDEPVLIALRSRVPVAIGRDRPAVAQLLLAQHPEIDVLVSDDGLQHYRLRRDVEIVVVDAQRRFGNGLLLPAGPLREPVSRLAEVDVVLVNGSTAPDESGLVLQADAVVAMDGTGSWPLADFAGETVHAVAGIGHPPRFFATLRAAGIEVIEHGFPDHHQFTPDDLEFGDSRKVLMTEKDAVKCRAFSRAGWFAVPVAATLPSPALARILERLDRSRE